MIGTIDYDVVVVGAGPVGLLTAIELGLGGVSVLVIERLAYPSTAMKGLGFGALASEALSRRGMASAIAAAEARSKAEMEKTGADLSGRAKASGHFAGLSLIRKDAQKEPERRARGVDQPSLEAMLTDRVHSLGIEVRRSGNVTNLVQDADNISLEWTTPTGGGHVSCSYLVGCDGGRSIVRKMAGFDFPGTPPTLTYYQALAEIDHPERLLPIGWQRTPGGVFSYGPLPGRIVMLDFSGPPKDREAPVTHAEIEEALRRISGVDVHVKVLETGSRWTDNTRLADTYRRGRVLLAGDAAHVHSPFGGQGLSLGLVDAANLGWKLASVIKGEMPESLLDTYEAERRPIAEAVLANTLAQVAIMRPDPQTEAMREIVANLMKFDNVNRFFGDMMSGLYSRYDLGSEQDEVGQLIGDKPIQLIEGEASLYDLMQDGNGVLLDATSSGDASKVALATSKKIRCVATDYRCSMLIRPDACIAWVRNGNSIDGLEEALQRWFPSLSSHCEAPSEVLTAAACDSPLKSLL